MNENNHPINDVLKNTMSKIREMVDANTVVGQPIETRDGITLIPVSHLSFGFATGGSDFGKTPNVTKNFGGGAGLWVWLGVSRRIGLGGNFGGAETSDAASGGRGTKTAV